MPPRVVHAYEAVGDNNSEKQVSRDRWNADHLIEGLGSAAEAEASAFATAAQGALADSAVQPGDLATVATSGAYSDLSGAPTLREVLTAARTYYVRTDGSDSNTGLANTSGGAFLTIQHAINVAAALDLSIYDVTIQVGAGTYTATSALKTFVGAGKIIIVGDETTPSNVLISVSGAGIACFTAAAVLGVYSLRGMKLVSANNRGLTISDGSVVEFQNLDFGACGTDHMQATTGATIVATGNYLISGGGARHMLVNFLATIRTSSRTVTISNTPAFSQFFCQAAHKGLAVVFGMTFSGTGATGARFSVAQLSEIHTNGGGASYLPGDSGGTTDAATYGLYV